MQVVQGTANLVPRATAGPPGKFNGIIPQPVSLLWKFHDGNINRFLVMLLTSKYGYKVTNIVTKHTGDQTQHLAGCCRGEVVQGVTEENGRKSWVANDISRHRFDVDHLQQQQLFYRCEGNEVTDEYLLDPLVDTLRHIRHAFVWRFT